MSKRTRRKRSRVRLKRHDRETFTRRGKRSLRRGGVG